MTNDLEIRDSEPQDADDIARLYAAAFPDEDLVPLVMDLLDLERGVMSLIARSEGKTVGHIGFTICQTENGNDRVALLAPLAVSPIVQKQGIGNALVRAGFERLSASDIDCVLVLGDPAYYGRFGFEAETKITPPYPLPTQWHAAWQSIHLREGASSAMGKLLVPEPWQDPALWGA